MNRFSKYILFCLLFLAFAACSDDGGDGNNGDNNNQPGASNDVQVLPTGTEEYDYSFQYPMPIDDNGELILGFLDRQTGTSGIYTYHTSKKELSTLVRGEYELSTGTYVATDQYFVWQSGATQLTRHWVTGTVVPLTTHGSPVPGLCILLQDRFENITEDSLIYATEDRQLARVSLSSFAEINNSWPLIDPNSEDRDRIEPAAMACDTREGRAVIVTEDGRLFGMNLDMSDGPELELLVDSGMRNIEQFQYIHPWVVWMNLDGDIIANNLEQTAGLRRIAKVDPPETGTVSRVTDMRVFPSYEGDTLHGPFVTWSSDLNVKYDVFWLDLMSFENDTKYNTLLELPGEEHDPMIFGDAASQTYTIYWSGRTSDSEPYAITSRLLIE